MSPPMAVFSSEIADPMYVELPCEGQDYNLDDVILPLSLPPPTFLEAGSFNATPMWEEEFGLLQPGSFSATSMWEDEFGLPHPGLFSATPMWEEEFGLPHPGLFSATPMWEEESGLPQPGSFSVTPEQQQEEPGLISLPPGLDVSFLDYPDVNSGSPSSVSTEASTIETTDFLNGEWSPKMKKVGGKSGAKSKKKQADVDTRWWTQSGKCLMCPLTNFPINLLPYPPFKLRVDPHRPNPHKLVDGKFLAMQVIATGSFVACGRVLQETDMKALDDYCHRCRLGPFRPGKAMALWSEVQKAKEHRSTEPKALKAMQELASYVKSARAELGKLRRIQENRMIQMQEQRMREMSECVDDNSMHFVEVH